MQFRNVPSQGFDVSDIDGDGDGDGDGDEIPCEALCR